MKITAILPVSRIQYLDKVLESLEKQTLKPNNLLVVFDGADSSFLMVRNKVAELRYDTKLCVPSVNNRIALAISERRVHIVNIHNQIRGVLGDCDWVFSIEDDGILPKDALERLVNTVKTQEDVGMVTGVELGRWGVPYVGAWRVDDVFNTKKITSMENKATQNLVEEIDGCGLYCALIRADSYKQHTFSTNNGIGPDVNLGLFLRQQGLNNYINWSVPVTHLTNMRGQEIEIPADSKSQVVTLQLLSGSTWKH